MPSSEHTDYQGRLSDGRTAAAAPAAVRLTPHGVEIAPGNGPAPLTWAYRELATATPLRASASDVLLSHSGTPGATLFVADRGFVAALAAQAPHLSTRSQRWRFARPLLLTCGTVALAVAGLWVADVRLSRGLARLMPTEVRQSLGKQVVVSLGGGRLSCETPDGSAALERLTQRLSAATGGGRFKVVVLNWDLLNAFAAPGEQIVLTRAVIEQAKSPDEVAGVLAHEMGHGIELHPESALIRAIGLGTAMELMLGGSGGTLANIGILLVQLGYSREAEREADAHAVRILKRAGISPKGFSDFFETVEDKLGGGFGKAADGTGKRLLTFLSTHPLTEERIAMVRSQPPYPATPALSDTDWQALQQVCSKLAPESQRRPRKPRPPAPPSGDRKDGDDRKDNGGGTDL